MVSNLVQDWAPGKVRIFTSIMHISSLNPMFDHLLESIDGFRLKSMASTEKRFE